MNPCPCGFAGDPGKQCVCSPSQVTRYAKRISGPLLDRIDLFVEVPRVEYDKLTRPPGTDTSARTRERIEAARLVQARRLEGTGLITNSEMGPVEVWEYCKVDDTAAGLLRMATSRLHLSARAFHRVLKLARTIADLGGGRTSSHRTSPRRSSTAEASRRRSDRRGRRAPRGVDVMNN